MGGGRTTASSSSGDFGSGSKKQQEQFADGGSRDGERSEPRPILRILRRFSLPSRQRKRGGGGSSPTSPHGAPGSLTPPAGGNNFVRRIPPGDLQTPSPRGYACDWRQSCTWYNAYPLETLWNEDATAADLNPRGFLRSLTIRGRRVRRLLGFELENGEPVMHLELCGEDAAAQWLYSQGRCRAPLGPANLERVLELLNLTGRRTRAVFERFEYPDEAPLSLNLQDVQPIPARGEGSWRVHGAWLRRCVRAFYAADDETSAAICCQAGLVIVWASPQDGHLIFLPDGGVARVPGLPPASSDKLELRCLDPQARHRPLVRHLMAKLSTEARANLDTATTSSTTASSRVQTEAGKNEGPKSDGGREENKANFYEGEDPSIVCDSNGQPRAASTQGAEETAAEKPGVARKTFLPSTPSSSTASSPSLSSVEQEPDAGKRNPGEKPPMNTPPPPRETSSPPRETFAPQPREASSPPRETSSPPPRETFPPPPPPREPFSPPPPLPKQKPSVPPIWSPSSPENSRGAPQSRHSYAGTKPSSTEEPPGGSNSTTTNPSSPTPEIFVPPTPAAHGPKHFPRSSSMPRTTAKPKVQIDDCWFRACWHLQSRIALTERPIEAPLTVSTDGIVRRLLGFIKRKDSAPFMYVDATRTDTKQWIFFPGGDRAVQKLRLVFPVAFPHGVAVLETFRFGRPALTRRLSALPDEVFSTLLLPACVGVYGGPAADPVTAAALCHQAGLLLLASGPEGTAVLCAHTAKELCRLRTPAPGKDDDRCLELCCVNPTQSPTMKPSLAHPLLKRLFDL